MSAKFTRVVVGVALLLMAHMAIAEDANAGDPKKQFKGPVKVFILAGQSNMEGQGSVDHDYNGEKGNLVWSMKHSKSAVPNARTVSAPASPSL